MRDLITGIDYKTGELIIDKDSALPGFYYKDGYILSCTDLGKAGVKIELTHRNEGSGAIILPPDKAQDYLGWLLQTLGHRNHALSEEFVEILKRLINEKKLDKILKRGDKKKVKDVLKFLKNLQSRN